MLMVNAQSSVRTVSDLVKLAKAKPGTLNFGSGGPGTTQHLSGELFKHMADIDIVHVPFKGGALATAALMGGEIHLQFDSAYPGMRSMKTGKLQGIALTGTKRLAELPDMPTMSETLKGYESVLGYGIVVRTGTPPEIVAALNRDVNKVLAEAAYQKEMASRAIELDGGTPEQFKSWLASERKKWSELLQRLDLKLG
jgi:tripartite-type tricarboxylate transporter receptor subunit TctC